jgi:hypothetical protein
MYIGYLTEPMEPYMKALEGAKTLKSLAAAVQKYKKIAADACAVVDGMGEADFTEWRRGLASERKKEFAGDEWCQRFGAILIPRVMLEVGLVANHFVAPWGCAYIRMREEGRISEAGGVASIVTEPAKKKKSRPRQIGERG